MGGSQAEAEEHMRLIRTFNAGYDNLYLNKDDVDRLLKGQMIKESSLIVQMEKPEREWVGLTADQMTAIAEWQLSAHRPLIDVIKAVEQALKEKNT